MMWMMMMMMMKRPKWRLALLLPAAPDARSRSLSLLSHDLEMHDFNKGDSDEGPSQAAIEGEKGKREGGR